eukprot:TRINITY_DN456_c0_g2_i1.p1 TRINITY_DN456_c0_g2~~TRINITY_DN456_c0_g2_i1.p1  ORF type:complete len:277 (+),score=59.48 TRINITY_DN456_c0_g2_i1:104-934(+)
MIDNLITLHPNIDYGGSYNRTLDIYIEKIEEIQNKKNALVLIYVHGGLWRDGNKDLYSHFKNICSSIKIRESKKYSEVVVSIMNYPLSGEENNVKGPIHTIEVAKAFEYILNKAPQKYDFSSENEVYLVGHSCGCTMNMAIYMDPKRFGQEISLMKNIRGIFNISGIFDMESFSKEIPQQFLNEFYLSHPKEDINDWPSPNKISLNNPQRCKLMFYQSKEDPYVELSQSINFSNQMSLKGFSVKVKKIESGDHYYAVRDHYEKSGLGDEIIEFILS